MNNSLKILLIEDDQIEVMKFNRAVAKLEVAHKIQNAEDGEVALRLLEERDRLPNLILLDLNMPKINGVEFLSILKNDEILKYIPVVVLSTSSNKRDLLECYKLGIAGYVLKPLKYEEYVEKIKKVLSYWSINSLVNV